MTNDTTTPPPIRTEPGPAYWYWSDSDDGERPLLGPSKTKVEAVDDWLAECGDDLRRELEPEGELPLPITDGTLRQMCPHVAQYRRPSSGNLMTICRLTGCSAEWLMWPHPVDLKSTEWAINGAHIKNIVRATMDELTEKLYG